MELTLESVVAFGQVTRESALVAARDGLPKDTQTTQSRASLTLLTVGGGEDGTVTLHRRPVWLVTFPEAKFVAGDVCICEGAPARPGTVVAVDAADGAILASFGVDT